MHRAILSVLVTLATVAALSPPLQAAGDSPAVFQFKVYRDQQPPMLVMVENGEAAEIGDKANGGKLSILLRQGERGVEAIVSRPGAPDRPAEVLALTAGQAVATRALASPLRIELVSPAGANLGAGTAAAELIEITVTWPSGKSVKAVADRPSGEMVQLASPEIEGTLGLRAALKPVAGRPTVEVFRLGRAGTAPAKALLSVPLGSALILPAAELGGVGDIRLAAAPADPTMWASTAAAGGVDSVIQLRVRTEDGGVVTGAVAGSEIFRVSRPGLAFELGFAPAAMTGDTLTLAVLRITRAVGGGEKLEALETIELARGAERALLATPGLSAVEFVGARPPLVRGRCWLGCGVLSGHGCAVSCGDEASCCTGVCCPI